MKKRHKRLPRKLKKALKDLRCDPSTRVVFRPFCFGHYPRTKWVVAAERQFRRLIREYHNKGEMIKALEEVLGV